MSADNCGAVRAHGAGLGFKGDRQMTIVGRSGPVGQHNKTPGQLVLMIVLMVRCRLDTYFRYVLYPRHLGTYVLWYPEMLRTRARSFAVRHVPWTVIGIRYSTRPTLTEGNKGIARAYLGTLLQVSQLKVAFSSYFQGYHQVTRIDFNRAASKAGKLYI